MLDQLKEAARTGFRSSIEGIPPADRAEKTARQIGATTGKITRVIIPRCIRGKIRTLLGKILE